MDIKQKRQYYHRILIQLGEEKYKDLIVEAFFPGCTSTTTLDDAQISKLIADAERRLGERNLPKPARPAMAGIDNAAVIRSLRNKCLQVLAQRGIKATPRDWSSVNKELEAARYQWILTDEQRAKGYKNRRGLALFTTVDDLRKLFRQLCKIRDNEQIINNKIAEMASKN